MKNFIKQNRFVRPIDGGNQTRSQVLVISKTILLHDLININFCKIGPEAMSH